MLSFFAILLSACSRTATKKIYSLDGVKLIAQGSTNPREVSHFTQSSYTVSPRTRLLLRYEELLQEASDILITEEKQVYLLVTLTDSTQFPTASRNLKLCPLTTNWSMLATWLTTHPFSEQGKWAKPGGDFSDSACLEFKKFEQNKTGYNITQWAIDYPRGRTLNYGFILVSEIPIEVHGDESVSHSPRLEFERLVPYEWEKEKR